MKKAWDVLTKTVGTFVIIGMSIIGILVLIDTITSKTYYSFNDDEEDIDLDAFEDFEDFE